MPVMIFHFAQYVSDDLSLCSVNASGDVTVLSKCQWGSVTAH